MICHTVDTGLWLELYLWVPAPLPSKRNLVHLRRRLSRQAQSRLHDWAVLRQVRPKFSDQQHTATRLDGFWNQKVLELGWLVMLICSLTLSS